MGMEFLGEMETGNSMEVSSRIAKGNCCKEFLEQLSQRLIKVMGTTCQRQ